MTHYHWSFTTTYHQPPLAQNTYYHQQIS